MQDKIIKRKAEVRTLFPPLDAITTNDAQVETRGAWNGSSRGLEGSSSAMRLASPRLELEEKKHCCFQRVRLSHSLVKPRWAIPPRMEQEPTNFAYDIWNGRRRYCRNIRWSASTILAHSTQYRLFSPGKRLQQDDTIIGISEGAVCGLWCLDVTRFQRRGRLHPQRYTIVT